MIYFKNSFIVATYIVYSFEPNKNPMKLTGLLSMINKILAGRVSIICPRFLVTKSVL